MDLEEAIDILIGIIKNRTEERMYRMYLASMPFFEKPVEYGEYLVKSGLIKKPVKEVNGDKIREDAKETLRNLFS